MNDDIHSQMVEFKTNVTGWILLDAATCRAAPFKQRGCFLFILTFSSSSEVKSVCPDPVQISATTLNSDYIIISLFETKPDRGRNNRDFNPNHNVF